MFSPLQRRAQGAIMNDPINLLDYEIRKNPYPTYARLRDSPVQRVEPMGLWAVSRHEDVEYVLRSPQLFSSAGFGALLKPDWLPHNPIAESILTLDDPGHGKLRALLSHAFTARAVARIEPRIRAIAAELAARVREL